VIDELRGVLIPSTDDTVLLEWSFDESSKSEE
jgi:hypothetical protein